MAFISLDSADLTQDKPFTTDLALQIKDDLDALNGSITSIASADIPNGSFEVDSDSNGVPDNWTVSTYAGGTVARDTTTTAHGEASIKMVHPGGGGNGGGYAVSDYVACNELEKLALKFIHWATAAGMRNQVIFYWYDEDRVACSTPSTTVYNSTANPTSETLFIKEALPPATCRFFKVRIVGGESSTNVAGTAYFDGLELTMTTDQVLYATSLASLGVVGTYAMLRGGEEVSFTAGTSYAGSGLAYSGVSIDGGVADLGFGATPSGTWRAQGTVAAGSGAGTQVAATLFLRIS